MRQTTKELLAFLTTLILAFLLLTHSTGFARDVGAVSRGGVGLVKVLQGR